MGIYTSSVVCFGFRISKELYDKLVTILDKSELMTDTKGAMVIVPSSLHSFKAIDSMLDQADIDAKQVKLTEVNQIISADKYTRFKPHNLNVSDEQKNKLIELMKENNVNDSELGLWFIEYSGSTLEQPVTYFMKHKFPVV